MNHMHVSPTETALKEHINPFHSNGFSNLLIHYVRNSPFCVLRGFKSKFLKHGAFLLLRMFFYLRQQCRPWSNSALCLFTGIQKWEVYLARYCWGYTLVIWAVTCDFQQCGLLKWIDSDEPVQPPVKFRNSKWCSINSLTLIKYSSDKQRLWSDCAYVQVDLRLC